MKGTLFNLMISIGVLCFIVGAFAAILEYLNTPLSFALPVIGLILIGAGASGKRRANG